MKNEIIIIKMEDRKKEKYGTRIKFPPLEAGAAGSCSAMRGVVMEGVIVDFRYR